MQPTYSNSFLDGLLERRFLHRLTQMGFGRHIQNGQVFFSEKFFPKDNSFHPSNIMDWIRFQCDLAQATVLLRSSEEPRRIRAHNYCEVEHGLNEGKTVQISQFQKYVGLSSELMALTRAIELASQFPIESISLFLTPQGQQGLPIHKDNVCVVTIQCYGTKIWKLWEDYKDGSVSEFCITHPERQIAITSGCLLFVPRHIPHSVSAGGETSVSVGLIFRRFDLSDVMSKVLKNPDIAAFINQSHPIIYQDGSGVAVKEMWAELLDRLDSLSEGELVSILRGLHKASIHGRG